MVMLWWVLVSVLAAGCVGGLVNGLLAGELVLPRYKKACRTYFPGIVGNVVLGGVGAVVFWGLYGPMAEIPLFGQRPPQLQQAATVALSLGDLLGSLVVGIGGGQLLTGEAERRCLKRGIEDS
jgi:hypothetical protein